MHPKTWTFVLILFALFTGIGLGGRLLAQAEPETAQESAAALATAFTYQGQLQDGGSPADGVYDLQFTLYDALSGGAAAGSSVTLNDVTVSGGIFTVELDFGGSAFTGDARWLEIGVRPGSDTGAYTTLAPRQPLTAAPYALYAAGAPWSGLSGVPAGFADGTDDNTAYTAGGGLALNGTQFNVAALPQAGYTNNTLASTGTTGQYPAVIIGLDGLPIISYYNVSNGDLEVYHCDDMTCSSGTRTTLDSAGVVGEYSSITIGGNGNPLISYYDRTNGDLKLALCLNAACTSANVILMDSGFSDDVGRWTSITTVEDGYAFVSYYNVTNGDLEIMRCHNAACSLRTATTVDAAGDVGKYSSVVRSNSNYVYISYYDATNGDLKVARCANSCSSLTIRVVDGADIINGEEEDVGLWSSITVLMDDYPVIAYAKASQTGSTSEALVAHCTNSSCSTATTDTIVSMGSSGPQFQGFSTTVAPSGQALIAFAWDTAAQVYMGFCRDLTCTGTSLNDKAVVGGGPRHTSLTIGADGLPIFVYYDDSGGDLKIVHCSDQSCQPYLRRR